ncbi:MAG: hypothetical protein WA945_09930 [Arcobacteraceae bacterium]
MLQNDRYIGGGKLFFTPKDGSEYEIGEVQSAEIEISTETKDAMNKDQVINKKVAKVVTSISASIKFETQITNAANTAMFMLGSEDSETFAIGDDLPDGTTATAETVIPVITAGTNPLIEGSFKFVGDEDGDKKPVLIVPSAVVTPSGSVGYIVDDFTKLSFAGEILEEDGVFYKEYRMTVG